MQRPLLAVLVLVAAALSGCSAADRTEGPPMPAQGWVAFNGPGNGDDADGFACDGTADLRITGSLETGAIRVNVTDAVGRTYGYAIGGPNQVDHEDDLVDGWAAGQWTIHVERYSTSTGDFRGQYLATVTC